MATEWEKYTTVRFNHSELISISWIISLVLVRTPSHLQASIAYFFLIFGIKLFMKNRIPEAMKMRRKVSSPFREPFDLQRPLNIWNAILALFSTLGFLFMAPDFFGTLWSGGFRATYCNLNGIMEGTPGIWTFVFFLSKLAEFTDTFFIVLRKKPLMFLHWYHHILTLLYAEGMLTTLIVCLCLTTTLHADDIDTRLVSATSTSTLTSTIGSSSLSSANTSSSSLIDVKEELLKIATTCLSPKDFELLTGNVLRHGVVRMFIHTLIEESVETIGLRELRTALKLPPPAPWQPRNRTEPTEHELASASTIEEYYKLREPRSKMGSLDSEYLFEHNVATAIAYLNKRLPSIQTVFRRAFEELCPSAPKVLNKKAIDSMIEAFHATLTSINNATSKMLRKYECQDV
ncbi:hypothetical protein PRIPAC_87826, partial [Pristionchus pacificus]|uniref:Elongation of very long chain fatty acids protein n=1 Tax=Pristionchus pacificus TaxID=54126 RepID=A0A2A6CX90_PRIPA